VKQKCDKLNNFNGIMEIMSGKCHDFTHLTLPGLNNSAIQRLKKLWASISEKRMRTFNELEELMNGQQNFKSYHAELNSRSLPILPYFGEEAFYEH
jgi:hypothetical protein